METNEVKWVIIRGKKRGNLITALIRYVRQTLHIFLKTACIGQNLEYQQGVFWSILKMDNL